MTAFFSIVGLGFVFFASPGPINFETVRRGVNSGPWSAFCVQIGAVLAELALGVVVLLGLAPLMQRLDVQLAFSLFSAGLLLWIAGMALRDARHAHVVSSHHAERAHLLVPEIDLSTHVQDILNVLFYEDLHEVVLVVHSAAGAVVTAVAERVPERIVQLVYLEALVPENGLSYADLLPPAMWANLREQAEQHGRGWCLPPSPPQLFGITNEADAAWVQARLVPHPLKTLTQPVRTGNEQAKDIRRTVIDATQACAVGQLLLIPPQQRVSGPTVAGATTYWMVVTTS